MKETFTAANLHCGVISSKIWVQKKFNIILLLSFKNLQFLENLLCESILDSVRVELGNSLNVTCVGADVAESLTLVNTVLCTCVFGLITTCGWRRLLSP